MLSGPIVAMVWEGREVVKTGRGKFTPAEVLCFFESMLTSYSHPRCYQPPGLSPWHHPW